MKSFLLICFMMIAADAMAVCSSPISRTNYSTGQVLSSASLNSQLNTAYTRVNELPGDCIEDETISDSQIAMGAAISRSKLGTDVSYELSASSGVFSTNSTSYVDATNLSVSITTRGGPVEAYLVADGTSSSSYISLFSSVAAGGAGDIIITDGSTHNAVYLIGLNADLTGGEVDNFIPTSSIKALFAPSAGSYTFKVQAKTSAATATLGIFNAKLFVREL